MIEPSRRKFIGSLITLVAAPAIVRVASIMPVKAMEPLVEVGDGFFAILCPEQYAALLNSRMNACYEMTRKYLTENINRTLYHGIGSPNSFLGALE